MSIARAKSWVEVAVARAREAVLGSMAQEILSGLEGVKVSFPLVASFEGIGL